MVDKRDEAKKLREEKGKDEGGGRHGNEAN